MSDTSDTQNPVATAPRKTRKPRAPRAPRNIDPGIAAIHAETKAKVAQYRMDKRSNNLLGTILNKRLAQLTPAHRQQLFDELAKTCTPGLKL